MEEKEYKGSTSVYELSDGHSSELFTVLDRGKKVSVHVHVRVAACTTDTGILLIKFIPKYMYMYMHLCYVPLSIHVQ